MNWPLFTNPALLGGLAAVAIPVLVHLLLKSRSQRLRFSTLRFFKQQDPRATQRRKLRNWFLLSLRMLLLILLALGFARPYLAGHSAAATDAPRRQIILVVDRSASMLAREREGPRWERATQAIHKTLETLRSGEVATFISCASRVENILGPAPAKDVLQLLDTLRPEPVATEVAQGLDLAAKLALGAGAGYSNVICVVSDLQRNSWRDLASHPIPVNAELQILNLGDRFAPNLAIPRFQPDSGFATNAAGPGVTFANFSDEDAPGLKAQLLVDGKAAQNLAFSLPANATTNLEITLPRLAPGWHAAEMRLQSGDALALDNSHYRAIYVPPPVRVLAIESHPELETFRQETFFLLSALDPAQGTTNAIPSPFQVTKVSPADALAKLAPGTNLPQVVVIPGLKHFPAGLGERLQSYVREGGGLMLFLGESASAIRYPAELGELLPAQWSAWETAGEVAWRLWEKDPQSPLFTPFNRPNSGNLMLAKFTRRAALRGFEGSRVHARFQDGLPLLLGRESGRGRILLVNTSADTAWTDWPKHRTYVPWLHTATRFLAGDHLAVATNLLVPFVSGASADLPLGAAHKKTVCKLQRPEGPELTGATDETGVWRDCPLAAPGIYSVRAVTGQELRRVAVNPPLAESDLAAFSPHDFTQQIVRADPPTSSSLAASLLAGADGRMELWRFCLLAALGLLFLELALANRTYA
jgi:hypothetical protein